MHNTMEIVAMWNAHREIYVWEDFSPNTERMCIPLCKLVCA